MTKHNASAAVPVLLDALNVTVEMNVQNAAQSNISSKTQQKEHVSVWIITTKTLI